MLVKQLRTIRPDAIHGIRAFWLQIYLKIMCLTKLDKQCLICRTQWLKMPENQCSGRISNRHFDLRGVVARLSEELDLHTRVREYTAEEAEEGGGETATWIAVSRDASAFDSYDNNWYPAEASGSVWTDDHANVLSALN